MVPKYPDATDTKGLYELHKGDAGAAWNLELQQQRRRAGPKEEKIRHSTVRCSKMERSSV